MLITQQKKNTQKIIKLKHGLASRINFAWWEQKQDDKTWIKLDDTIGSEFEKHMNQYWQKTFEKIPTPVFKLTLKGKHCLLYLHNT